MGLVARWLAAHALRAFPEDARQAALANEQIARVIRLRFAYFFAVHGAVVFLLLKLISGGDAWAIFSFGLASLIMVPGELFGGVLADRHGPKWAVRNGLKLMAGVMLAFAALLIARATTLDALPAGHQWLPGVLGICGLELTIGVALSLINGADTVLFVNVGREANIEGLNASAFEGVGSALRYYGTMFAVAAGVGLYYGVEAIAPDPATAMALQSSVFFGTFCAQVYALQTLSGVMEQPGGDRRRATLGQILVAASSLRVQPALLRSVAGAAVGIGAAQLAIYYLQSPMETVVDVRADRSKVWYVAYAAAIMTGYWASVQGSRLFARIRARGAIDFQRGAPALLACTFLALLLFPLLFWSLGEQRSVTHDTLYFVTCAVALMACGALRGLFEPWARTSLVEFSHRRQLGMPTALVSGFNAGIRISHFLIATAVGALIGTGPLSAGLGQVAQGLAWASLIVAGLLVVVASAAWLIAAADRGEEGMPERLSVVVIGSYKEDMAGLLRLCGRLAAAGHVVLHPPPTASVVGQQGDFVRLNCDPSDDEGAVQRRVFGLIDVADLVVAYTPGGRVGMSTAMEIGYAIAKGRPVATTAAPQDVTLRRLLPQEPHELLGRLAD